MTAPTQRPEHDDAATTAWSAPAWYGAAVTTLIAVLAAVVAIAG